MTTSLLPFHASFGMLENFRREMNQLFERFGDSERETDSSIKSCWTPRLNLSETEQAYEVCVDLPGLTPDAVNVELRHGDLWITGERQYDFDDKGRTWHRVECWCGPFRRVVRLGDDVDPSHVEAQYRDGVLHVTVPKAEAARTQRIEIKS
jgi:HSP20 family protein